MYVSTIIPEYSTNGIRNRNAERNGSIRAKEVTPEPFLFWLEGVTASRTSRWDCRISIHSTVIVFYSIEFHRVRFIFKLEWNGKYSPTIEIPWTTRHGCGTVQHWTSIVSIKARANCFNTAFPVRSTAWNRNRPRLRRVSVAINVL